MILWVQIFVAGALLAGVVAYAILHFIPGRYRSPRPDVLQSVEDGVYVFLNPG